MSQTFFEKWKHRFSSAWDVLTGRAWAGYGKRHEKYYVFVTANGVHYNAGYYDNEIKAGLAADQLIKETS